MRLLGLEMKRVIKTRLTWILLLLALFTSVALAYIPTTFTPVSYKDEQGNKVVLNGLESINYIKESQKNITGVITPEIIRKAVEDYQACLRKYNVTDTYELPDGVYVERILPIAPLLHGISEVFTDPKTGMAPSIMEITAEQAAEFYATAPKRLESLMKMEQKDYPMAQTNAINMYNNVEMPFVFYPGSLLDVMDYQTILIFLISLFCVVISASIFSSDYQTEADAIQRCTKHGRNRLGIIKIISALGICTLAFILCLGVYAFISNSLFGWECTKTSVQMMASVSNLLPFNMGQLQGFVAIASGVSFVAAISTTLFISSKCKTTTSALSISILVLLLPIILYFIVPGAFGTLIRSIFPSGGIGLQNSYLYAMLDFEFINIGQLSVWTPYAMLTVAVIAIPIFIGLTLVSYTKHSIK